MEILNGVFEWLAGIYLHPLVTAIIVASIALGRLKFEAPILAEAGKLYEQSIKALPEESAAIAAESKELYAKGSKVSNYVFLVTCFLAIMGQFAFYWPTTGQSRAICFVMSVAQVGLAEVIYIYADRWGIMDRLGKIVQKKMDDKAQA